MYRFNYVSLKIQTIFLCVGGDEIIVKFRWKSIGPGVGEISGNKNRVSQSPYAI